MRVREAELNTREILSVALKNNYLKSMRPELMVVSLLTSLTKTGQEGPFF